VGTELVRLGPAWAEVIALDSGQLDVRETEIVYRTIREIKPALVINASAYTLVDRAETEQQRAYAVNRDGAVNLAHAAESLNIPFFHISTDYVFDGKASEPYEESSAADPGNVYGRSKLAGEQGVVATCPRHIILRTSWVFSAHGTNFLRTMLRLGDERSQLRVVSDQHGGPTSAVSIARTLWNLAHRYRDAGAAELEWGIFHFSGAPATTWYGFAQEIFSQAHQLGIMERVPDLAAVTTEEYPTEAQRPAYSVLNCKKLFTTHHICQPDWREDLQSVLLETQR